MTSTDYRFYLSNLNDSTINLTDLKFKCVTESDTILFTKTVMDANPSYVLLGNDPVYPIPAGEGPVIENATTGDGEPVDSESLKPREWENCYFAYADEDLDDKFSRNDDIYLYKDYNDDGINEITSGFKFLILDNEDNEIWSIEL